MHTFHRELSVVNKNGKVLSPENVSVPALLDAGRVVAELEMAARALDVSFCIFSCDRTAPKGVDLEHGPLYAISKYCSGVVKRGGPEFAKRCVESNWAAAKKAAGAGGPTRASCACGRGLLVAFPVYLTCDGRQHPKLCLTATVYPLSGLRSLKRLSEITSMPEADLRSLIAEAESQALPPDRLGAIRKGLEIIASNLSAEMSSRYHLYREAAARAKAEKRLQRKKKSLELYRQLVDNVDDFVLMADVEGHILAANRKIRELLGYGQDDLRHLNAALLHPKHDLPTALGLTAEAFEKGIAKGRVKILTKDGREIPTEMNLCYSPEEQTLQAIFRDITDRLEMENELQVRSQQLELQNKKVIAATQLRTRFFASMSHEFRTPLTSVIGFAELMLEDGKSPLSPERRDYLTKISQNAHHLLQMVDDLLDIAKIESGRINVSLSSVDVAQTVQGVTTSIAPMLCGKEVSLVTDVQPGLPPIFTDEQKLGQILTNLLSNAVKFTDKGSITVTVALNNGKLRIIVQDTGAGIRRSDLRRIFEEFEQVDSPDSRKVKGTGLGLSLTKRLCHLLGGSIKAKSELGKGSTFTVILPVNLSESVVRRRVESLGFGRASSNHKSAS